jgi:hypothetical protein
MAEGGAVVSLAIANGRAWLATPAGLFQGAGQWWRPVVASFPYPQVNAVLAAGGGLFAAGMSAGDSGLVRSDDGGLTWRPCRVDSIESPISWLAASPDVERDGVLLAGTYGEGILRSSDGGRSWRLSNFGLQDFNILALAMAPDWGRREPAYAATEGGLYRSPNGGRAWRRVDLGPAGGPVQAVCVAPDGAIFASRPGQPLLRSTDAGATWQPVSGLTAEPPDVTCLLAGRDSRAGTFLLAGTAEHGILRADGCGNDWHSVWEDDTAGPVLCLGADGDHVYAGTGLAGVLVSADAGCSWTRAEGLAARRFARLVVPTPTQMFAAGPNEGVWASGNGGVNWGACPGWPPDAPVLALAGEFGRVGPILLGASTGGLLRSADAGNTWQTVLAPQAEAGPLTALACSPAFARDGLAWAGSALGRLWLSRDEGFTWAQQEWDAGAVRVAALAASPYFERDSTVVLAAADEAGREVQVWRSLDGGLSWEKWVAQTSDWLVPRLAPAGLKAARTGVALGAQHWAAGPVGWRRAEVASAETPLNALAAVPGTAVQIAARVDGVLIGRPASGAKWRPLETGLEAVAPADLALSPQFQADRLLYLLTVDGQVWRRRLGARKR